ncbi:GATOR2 complex protein MIOS-like isoform X3 [Saccostrea echinata]|uniref:GATOR2 complex protein MIOS-like isoform X3 n=1 Tax=Saccostrea echinata TaxID=191078 RepID=UPI002A81F1CD|nr:GATOR2 complex protein MIOS-like isoform X3 [Saccostrea echinata]
MSNLKVYWSPIYEDLFCTCSPNKILLYKLDQSRGKPSQKAPVVKQISDCLWAVEQPKSIEIGMLKTVAWYPKAEPDKMLAIGLANGRVILNNFSDNNESDLINKEFVPKHTRSCIYLNWNPVDCHLLAEGLEKYRNDSCINIWNIHHKPGNEHGDRQRYSSSHSDTTGVHVPYLEIGGPSETTASFDWFKKEPRTFVTGMNARYLRIYDLRDCTRPQNQTQTKMIRGVCVDRQNDHRIASFNENHVSVWDVRNFDKPMLTFQESKAVSSIRWCPTRKGYLGILSQDSLTVKIYDILHLPQTVGSEELDQYYSERTIKVLNTQVVTSFSWHPKHDSRLLTITQQGTLRDIVVHEHIPFNWSADSHLVMAHGKILSDNSLNREESGHLDISVKMKERIIQGYGLQSDHIWHNVFAVKDEPDLFGVWRWLSYAREMLEYTRHGQRGILGKHLGIKSILRLDSEDIPGSQMTNMYWAAEFSRKLSCVRQYHSAERTKALQLCGWGADKQKPEQLDTILHELQMDGKYSVAAAMALFNLQISKAIEILSTSSSKGQESTDLSTVAMAIAGYTDERNTLWRKTCMSLLQKLEDPYLRAMFAFLTSERENYEEILTDQGGMQLSDKIAFACIYLDDDRLKEYINRLTRKVIESGNLDGLLITGLTQDGVSLISKYVDLTGDVQTAALVCVFSLPNEMSKDERVLNWIESYRELLDRWRLWHHRSKFDIIWHTSDNFRVTSQAFVSCNFCGKSIACNMPVASRARPYNSYSAGTLTSTKPKVSCCPGCRKPLPRCSLCLMHLGTPSGSALYTQKDKTTYASKMTAIDDWFMWCQSCRHGGHASHLWEWFAEHSECPVTGCYCKCSTLDHTSRLNAES